MKILVGVVLAESEAVFLTLIFGSTFGSDFETPGVDVAERKTTGPEPLDVNSAPAPPPPPPPELEPPPPPPPLEDPELVEGLPPPPPPEGEGLGEGLGEGVGLGDGLGEGEGLGEGDGAGLGEGEGEGDGAGLGGGAGGGGGDGLLDSSAFESETSTRAELVLLPAF